MKDINLLPEEIKETEYAHPARGEGSPIRLVLGLVVALVLIAISIVTPMLGIKQKEQELESLVKEIESEKYDIVRQVNSQLSDINAVLDSKADVINTIDSMSNPVSEVITAIYNAAPSTVAITNIKFNNNKADVTGIAYDNVAFAEFLAAVNRVSLLTQSGRISFDESGIFQVTIKVGKGGA
ncbi:MAG TPA: fimbrial protein [Clostridium sp.]|nr:fimbrial protein [Clostridium sp.]